TEAAEGTTTGEHAPPAVHPSDRGEGDRDRRAAHRRSARADHGDHPRLHARRRRQRARRGSASRALDGSASRGHRARAGRRSRRIRAELRVVTAALAKPMPVNTNAPTASARSRDFLERQAFEAFKAFALAFQQLVTCGEPAIARASPPITDEPANDVLTADEAAAFLGVDRNT